MSKQDTLFHILLSLLLAVAIMIMAGQTWSVSAQATPDETSWTTPVNLSNSDLTSLPGIVSDQNGAVHVIWKDDTLGWMYTNLMDGVWSQPVAVKYPFTDFAPVLVDGGDYLHAFWINTNNDTLYHSRALPTKVGTDGGWEKARPLAKGVEDFKAIYRPDKTLHLAYMTSLEDEKNIPGVYYLRSIDSGTKWEPAIQIYTSRYFRSLDPAMANVDISAGSNGEQQPVFITWNNPALKRIFLAKSGDGGINWEVPMEVDGPNPSDTTNSPFNPILNVKGSDILLLWQANLQSDFACTLYYQWSNNNGSTWSERSRFLDEYVGCPQDNVLINANPDFTLLQTSIRDEVYMLAWDGKSWSKPLPQETLSGFNDPLTNEAVTYRCLQSTVQSGSTIYMVGCNEAGNIDIWVTSRSIGSKESWFPSTSLWEEPEIVFDSENEITSVQTVADLHGVFHILWRQEDKLGESSIQRSIYYARYNENVLSQPGRVLTSPDKMVDDFSLAYDQGRDRLAVVWTSDTTGEIFYSWADISSATSTFEWSKAVTLPTVRPLIKSPNILITPDGTIHVAYAVPLNEERGIYLISSTDGGETWGPAVRVFGVTDSDWQVIDYPILASSGDNILYIMWRRENIIGGGGAVGLYYSLSNDRGHSWSDPDIVSNEPNQGGWIIDGATQGVHRFWLSSHGNESSFYHEASIDQGANWTNQENLTGFGEKPGIAHPFINEAGSINFVQAVEYSPQNFVINHQQDNDGSWATLSSLNVGSGVIDEITSLSAQDLVDGRVVVAYSVNQTEPAEGDQPYRLYMALQGDIPVQATQEVISANVSPATPTALPQPTSTPTEPASTPVPTQIIQTPTPQLDLTASVSGDNPQSVATSTGLILSGGLAVLVVVGFFVYSRIRRP